MSIDLQAVLEDSRNNKRKELNDKKLRNTEESDKLIKLVLITFTSIFIYFISTCAYKWDQFRPYKLVEIFGSFLRFDIVGLDAMKVISSLLINTMFLGLLSTIIAAIIAFPFGLLAAENLSNKHVSSAIKGIAGFVRAIPTIVWVLLFISSYGLTAITAVIGMIFHGWSFFVKSFSESFEEVDPGTIEALKASGASWLQIVNEAVIPSSTSRLISWLAMRSEINFAVAVVIGPIVGVPGSIGSAVNSFSRGNEFPQLGFTILCIFITAYILEILVNKVRQKELA